MIKHTIRHVQYTGKLVAAIDPETDKGSEYLKYDGRVESQATWAVEQKLGPGGSVEDWIIGMGKYLVSNGYALHYNVYLDEEETFLVAHG